MTVYLIILLWIPWNLSFRYIHCTGQFTPKMKANANCVCFHLWCELTGVVVSQYRLETSFMKWNVTERQVSWNSHSVCLCSWRHIPRGCHSCHLYGNHHWFISGGKDRLHCDRLRAQGSEPHSPMHRGTEARFALRPPQRSATRGRSSALPCHATCADSW